MVLRFYPERYSDNYDLTISNFNTTVEYSISPTRVLRGAVEIDLPSLDLSTGEVYYITASDSEGVVWRGKIGNSEVKIENDNIIRI